MPKIEITSWKCNGQIHPLIRNVQDLKRVAGNEYPEAARWAAIHVDTHNKELTAERCPRIRELFYSGGKWESVPSSEMDAVVELYFTLRSKPYWSSRAPIVGECRTPAQLLAVHGNTDCRAACADIQDLFACIKLVGAYNDFDPMVVCDAFKRLDPRQCYGANNPNSGTWLVKFWFGWEGSTVIYARVWGGGIGVNYFTNQKMNEYDKLTAQDFASICKLTGDEAHADESSCLGNWHWRFWWD